MSLFLALLGQISSDEKVLRIKREKTSGSPQIAEKAAQLRGCYLSVDTWLPRAWIPVLLDFLWPALSLADTPSYSIMLMQSPVTPGCSSSF